MTKPRIINKVEEIESKIGTEREREREREKESTYETNLPSTKFVNLEVEKKVPLQTKPALFVAYHRQEYLDKSTQQTQLLCIIDRQNPARDHSKSAVGK